MDYWEAITKRWRRLPDFVFKHKDDPLYLRAYYETRDACSGSHVSRERVAFTLKKITTTPLPPNQIRVKVAPGRKSAKSNATVRYFAILHLVDGNKVIGPYNTLQTAHGARSVAIRSALRKGTAKEIERIWFNRRV